MTVWIGIDEAGYGPKVGPLSLGLVSLIGTGYADNFWQKLKPLVDRDPRHWRETPVICDSKELHNSRRGLEPLESVALSLLEPAASLKDLLSQLGDFDAGDFDRYPWYDGSFQLPAKATPSRIDSHRGKWQDSLAAAGVAIGPCLVRPVLTRRFNSMIRDRNKNALEFTAVMGLLDRALELLPGEEVRVEVDKLGGRDRYGEMLQTYFPMEPVNILEEGRHLSHYVLPARNLEIRFRMGGDRDSLVIAAASLLAKYVREVMMASLNTWWCTRVEGLKPTAGYPQDAERWLAAIGPTLNEAGYSDSWIRRLK